MVTENTMQDAKEKKKQLNSLTSCNPHESQQLPAWQDMHKGAVSSSHVSVAANSCPFELKAYSAGRKAFLVLEM